VFVGEKYKCGQYLVLHKLGWGHFSTVWLVLDNKTGEYAAMKVRRQSPAPAPGPAHDTPSTSAQPLDLPDHGPACHSQPASQPLPWAAPLQVQKSATHYSEAARDEITLLSQIKDGDPGDVKHCCRLLDWWAAAQRGLGTEQACAAGARACQPPASASGRELCPNRIRRRRFEHSGPNGRHVCMVFEVLGDNLLALIKRYDYKGVPIPVVRNLARQMLVGLDYLHRWV
jgi:serine/threonine-protein kinase SRPK3